MLHEKLLSLFQKGSFHQIISLVEEANVTPESDPTSSHFYAAALFKTGAISQASDILESLESALDSNVDYLSLYGATLRRLGDLSKAEYFLKKAISISPESISCQNNYANLLIDLQKYDQARAILESLLSKNPDYNDARVNLNRLDFKTQPTPNNLRHTSSEVNDSTYLKASLDPLLLSFSPKEVNEFGRLDRSKLVPSSNELVELLPSPSEASAAADLIKTARQAFSEKNYIFSLKLCSRTYEVIGPNATIFDCACDCYISLGKYREAEICALQAILIESPTAKLCMNLATLASLRNDLKLAEMYLDRASGIDPSHPQLHLLRSNLQKINSKETTPYEFLTNWNDRDLSKT